MTTLPSLWPGPALAHTLQAQKWMGFRLIRVFVHARAGLDSHHLAIHISPSPKSEPYDPVIPRTGLPVFLRATVVAASAMIPSLPLLPPVAGLLGPKDLYLCFRGLRRRSLLLW